MMFVRKNYLARRITGRGCGVYTLGKAPVNPNHYRDWFLIKAGRGKGGRLTLNTVYFSEDMVGKRVRFKVEVLED